MLIRGLSIRISDDQRPLCRTSSRAEPLPPQVATLLEEYFSGGDLGEAAAELADMGEPELQHFLVKRAVTAALDKHNREREMTSVLLSSLYSEARRVLRSIGRFRLESLCASATWLRGNAGSMGWTWLPVMCTSL